MLDFVVCLYFELGSLEVSPLVEFLVEVEGQKRREAGVAVNQEVSPWVAITNKGNFC
jgi:hypothetical protein